MQCPNCGATLGSEDTKCLHCGQTARVQILTPREREAFDGVTIDQESGENSDQEYRHTGRGQRIFVRRVVFGGRNGGLWPTLLSLVGIALFVALLVFVALPLGLLLAASGMLYWFLRRR